MNEFITNPQDCDGIYVEALKRGNKDLVAENQRLKEQFDREIKINRKMKSTLEKYAYEGSWDCLFDDEVYGKYPNTNWNADGNGYDLAQEVLKEIDNKE